MTVGLLSATASAQTFPGASWPTDTPESQGLDSAILASELAATPFPGNNGPFAVFANGQLVYSVGDITAPQPLFSCSKVLAGMVAARLIQLGTLPNLDFVVPNTVPQNWPAYPGDATLRQFMTMTSDYGLTPYMPAGGQFAYSNNGIDFYGEYLGQTYYGVGTDQMDDVLDMALFSVTGSEDPNSFVGQWGGWFGGMELSVRDTARLGYLLMQGGQWNGAQILDPEWVDGLFSAQIPASAQRYQSANPTENTQFNQQEVTNRLENGPFGNWSFGLWRVEDAKPDTNWNFAAAEGFRGKRVLMMPKGTLPNSDLEVLFVTLPNFGRSEGPDTDFYAEAIRRAVIDPGAHPNADDKSVLATFEDGRYGRLEPRDGDPLIDGGLLVLEQGQRMVFAEETMVDGHVYVNLPNGLPIPDTNFGIAFRAATPDDSPFLTSGTQSFVELRHLPSGVLRVQVVRQVGGMTTFFQGADRPMINPAGPIGMRISFVGDGVECSLNGFPGLPGIVTGNLNPGTDGYISIRAGGPSGAPVDVGLLCARSDQSPVAQISHDGSGRQSLVFLEPGLLSNFNLVGFGFRFDNVTLDPGTFFAVLPGFYSVLEAAHPDCLVLSQSTPPFFEFPFGTSIEIDYAGQTEGDFVR
ncbi:MAG: hypothetical protein AAF196_04265 [Planctomycetota bacterium]